MVRSSTTLENVDHRPRLKLLALKSKFPFVEILWSKKKKEKLFFGRKSKSEKKKGGEKRNVMKNLRDVCCQRVTLIASASFNVFSLLHYNFRLRYLIIFEAFYRFLLNTQNTQNNYSDMIARYF